MPERAAGSLPPGEAKTLAAAGGWRGAAHVLGFPVRLAAGATHDLLTTLFPGDCRACAAPLTRASRLPVCTRCLSGIEPRPETGCRRCGDLLPVADLEDQRFCGMECLACRLAPPAFERAVAFGDYENTLRELIFLLKYKGMSALAPRLGRALAGAVLGLRADAAAELLVIPVPLHPATERRRGYNQAHLLAQKAVRALRQRAPEWALTLRADLLLRRRTTAQQFTLSARARRHNLRGAFHCTAGSKSVLRGREVLLIDDILTTGATARECARVLLAAGASRVWVATVARACGGEGMRRPAVADTVARWDMGGEHHA